MNRTQLKTPCYVIMQDKLIKNLTVLDNLRKRTGCKILLAQKCFSCYSLYPLISQFVDGTEASGEFEARLGHEYMPDGENHTFSAGFTDEQFDEVLKYSDHVVFNSVKQFQKFSKKAKSLGKSVGLRINPECSTQTGHEIYDPCSPGSRLGVTRKGIDSDESLINELDGIHFHTLCEQNSDDLKTTLECVEQKFGDILPKLKWINFGGGHHITREDYDVETLVWCIERMQNKYGLTVYLEPGEAFALNAGDLITTVVDVQPEIARTGKYRNVIVDTSACCHMPDVLEMPYRAPLSNSGEPGQKAFTFRLGSQTCLAGDVIGDYSFDHELKEGDRLTFNDMAIYTMVKNNTFNGMPLPSIVIEKEDGECEIIKSFSYFDFLSRL